jgi:hypothetical protein
VGATSQHAHLKAFRAIREILEFMFKISESSVSLQAKKTPLTESNSRTAKLKNKKERIPGKENMPSYGQECFFVSRYFPERTGNTFIYTYFWRLSRKRVIFHLQPKQKHKARTNETTAGGARLNFQRSKIYRLSGRIEPRTYKGQKGRIGMLN